MTENNGRVVSASTATREARAARTAELVGDGSQITADDFAAMSYAERAQLHRVNREKYDELANPKGAFGGGL